MVKMGLLSGDSMGKGTSKGNSKKLFAPFDCRRRQLHLTRKELAAIVKKEKERTWKKSYAQRECESRKR
jgi:hypothetical protein